MPADRPDHPDRPDRPDRPQTARWHPGPALLDLLELVLDASLPPLPEVLARLGVTDLSALAAGAGHPMPPHEGPLLVEDAEGTPVALLDGAQVTAERPFAHPPLRSHRVRPADLAADPAAVESAGALVAVVTGLPASADVEAAVAAARAGGRGLVWLVVVGPGRGPLPPEGAWRAAGALVDLARAAGVPARAVPVVVPLLTGPAAGDALPGLVAQAWARHLGGEALVLQDAVEPAFARELARTGSAAPGRGVTIFFTGLSGSGKSTIAKALAARLTEREGRAVTLLDGDEVRRLLSHGLGFSRSDRDLNIRRIGFVAAEVNRHGGLAVCAPIAPFADVRSQVRADVERAGGELVLVHVATPLAECERRDRKGLYARARAGEIPDFTGISSPYEVPDDADLRLDTTDVDVDACVDAVRAVLVERGYLSESDPEETIDVARWPG